MTVVDHVVYTTPDLDVTVAAFTAATGVGPEPGGSHPDLGTRNAQVTLGDAYLELMGPQSGPKDPAVERLLGVERGSSGFVAIALRPGLGESIEDLVERASTVGFDLGPIVKMHRIRPDGLKLAWRMTMPDLGKGPGVPFLIDWGDTPLPSNTIDARAELDVLRLELPDSQKVVALHDALDSNVPVVRAEASRLVVEISGPAGSFRS